MYSLDRKVVSILRRVGILFMTLIVRVYVELKSSLDIPIDNRVSIKLEKLRGNNCFIGQIERDSSYWSKREFSLVKERVFHWSERGFMVKERKFSLVKMRVLIVQSESSHWSK